MRIYLDRYFNFFTHSHDRWVDVELTEPSSLGDVLSRVGIPIAEVHLAVVNGEAFNPEELIVSNSDSVEIFPPIGGG
jgi:sulfur carrier protein ThiS